MIKQFIKYYKPHMRLFILDMIAAVVLAFCNLAYPFIAKEMINDYPYRNTARAIIIGASILLIIYVVKAVCNYIVGYLGHVVGVRMQADMRRDLFAKYEKLPYSYFDKHKTGDLLSRLTNDLMNIAELAHHGPENIFLAVLMFGGSFFMLVSIDWRLTLIMFSVIPFIIIFTIISRRAMMTAMRASRKQMAEINITLENSITGIRETKAYAKEEHELERFTGVNKFFAKYRSDAMKALGSFSAIMEFMTDALYLTVIFAGGMFLRGGSINAGEFAAFLLYISMFLNPIRRIVTLVEQMQDGMSGFERFSEIMETPDEVDEGTIAIDEIRGDIVFENVSFHYDPEVDGEPRQVINNLSMQVGAGETLALVGPSGGGKSTLCNLIPRFYNIQEGSISIDGNNISDITLESLRKNIGIVSQNVFLFDGTVRENIAYGNPNATDEEIVSAAKKANIHEYVMTLEHGYDTEVGERGVKLSGGQKQRVSIARVFLKNPKLLILDEATSALDNATEMQIQASLEELSRGRTVIVVAHRLSTVKNADRIMVIDGGMILESGTHEELLSLGGEYSTLYAYQFKDR